MQIKALIKAGEQQLVKRSPEIITGFGVVGVVATAVFTFKATPKALELKRQREVLTDESGEMCETRVQMIARDARAMAPALKVPIISGTLTITAIVAGFILQKKGDMAELAKVLAAYSISETALHDYQRQVVAQVGEDAHAAIMEEVGLDRARKSMEADESPFEGAVKVDGNGDTLCYDAVTGSYFKSSVEKIHAAEGIVAKTLLMERVASVNDFYDALGVSSNGEVFDAVGWWPGEDPANVYFTSMLDSENRPCLVLNYRVKLIDRGYFRS